MAYVQRKQIRKKSSPHICPVGEPVMSNVVTLKLSKPASNQRKLQKLCKWIDANIEKQISWSELSQHSGMSHVELQRQFTVYMKISPMQWIRNRRTECQKITLTEEIVNPKSFPASLLQKR